MGDVNELISYVKYSPPSPARRSVKLALLVLQQNLVAMDIAELERDRAKGVSWIESRPCFSSLGECASDEQMATIIKMYSERGALNKLLTGACNGARDSSCDLLIKAGADCCCTCRRDKHSYGCHPRLSHQDKAVLVLGLPLAPDVTRHVLFMMVIHI
jgi:hypothetical protein